MQRHPDYKFTLGQRVVARKSSHDGEAGIIVSRRLGSGTPHYVVHVGQGRCLIPEQTTPKLSGLGSSPMLATIRATTAVDYRLARTAKQGTCGGLSHGKVSRQIRSLKAKELEALDGFLHYDIRRHCP